MQPSHTPLVVNIPLLNPNEVEAVLVSLPVRNGQQVLAGDLIAVIETTKSTGEITALQDGYVLGLHFSEGQPVRAGDALCFLAANPDDDVASLPILNPLVKKGLPPVLSIPTGMRITRPALILAQKQRLDLSTLPTDQLITESKVREALSMPLPEPAALTISPGLAGLPDHLASDDLIVYGGGGHGKSIVELIRLLGTYHIIGIVDDGLPTGETILGLPVLGGQGVLAGLFNRGAHLAINAVGGIGNLTSRLKVFETLAAAGFTCPPVVHPRAFVEASARLADGVQVFPHAYVGSDCQVGFGAIVNSGAIVSHDCRLGDYVNLSPGAILAGAVHVADRTLIGMGVTVNLEVQVGSGVRIGNGATVKANVPSGTIVKAGSIWPL